MLVVSSQYSIINATCVGTNYIVMFHLWELIVDVFTSRVKTNKNTNKEGTI